MKLTKIVATVAVATFTTAAFAGGAAAVPTAPTMIGAKLTAKAEIPAQVVKNTKGAGSFTGTLNGSKLTWKLTFSGLTGPATASHIHLGKAGKAGGVVVPLCAGAKCKSGVHGTATLSAAILKAVKTGGAYVNVHTAKNPNGEIRGQIAP
jgi:hypothetical protein